MTNIGGLGNAYARPPVAVPGTRLIQLVPGDPATRPLLDALGQKVEHAGRQWEILGFYLPARRALGGVRAWLEDNFEITSFCNQRDLEVLLELVSPESWCDWLGTPYADPSDVEWVGITATAEDLLDDLLRREWQIRYELDGGILSSGTEITRHIFMDGSDYAERLTLLWDADPTTGMQPDPRLETLQQRWARVEMERLRWK